MSFETVDELKQWVKDWESLVHSRDLQKIKTLFDDRIVFLSPAIYKPSSDKEYIIEILSYVVQVIEDFKYTDRIDYNPTSRTVTALFEGNVRSSSSKTGSLRVEGVDMFTLTKEGKIAELKVMVRPMNALSQVATQMKLKFLKGMMKKSSKNSTAIWGFVIGVSSVIAYVTLTYFMP